MPTQPVSQDAPPPTDWDRVAADQHFKDLIAAKKRFIVPATIFFVVYYFALPVLVGYEPELMRTPVFGPVNLAYLLALSEFFVAWLIAWLYMRAADSFDAMGKRILSNLQILKDLDKEKTR
jgi:uncharacterized membrane protein (DUF485 family)